MKMDMMATNDLYRDIQRRCNGEIYIGIVGPVRSGKSTFIKRFMDLLVLPNMADENEKIRTRDELPQSGGGRTITTTEPKFIPNEAARIRISEDVELKVRLIDCVGFMVDGAAGHMENGQERMVRTPWFEEAVPFSKAAEIGTRKVISEHSTVGIVIVGDGSFADLSTQEYLKAADEAINELTSLKKPFIVLLNTTKPYSEASAKLAFDMEEKYHVHTIPVNCAQLKAEDIYMILQELLLAFPVSRLCFYTPKWFSLLDPEHQIKKELSERIIKCAEMMKQMKDVSSGFMLGDLKYLRKCKVEDMNLADGSVKIRLDIDDVFYYELLSLLLDEPITNEHDLIHILRLMGAQKAEYKKVMQALCSVREKGYGVVTPEIGEITIQQPEVIKNGNKYGIKIIAHSPSIHMIKADIESEISPIVGTQAQAEDLISFISEEGQKEDGLWETNIFGKTIEQLVREGIDSKIANIGEESQMKLQETMQKIVNESNGGMVCIII